MDENDYGQVDLFSKQSAPTSSANEAFACCSRFRACSDAGACVIADRDYSVNCEYRRNLEAGNIFYGKKSASFSEDQYISFKNGYASLDAKAKDLLDSALKYFFFTKPATSRALVYRSPELEAIEKAGFISVDDEPKHVRSVVLPKLKMSCLETICKDLLNVAKAWVKERRKQKSTEENEEKKKKDIYRDELVEWIFVNEPPVSNEFWSDLAIISISTDSLISLNEFFHDYILPRVSDIPEFSLQADSDQRFLKSAK